MNTQEIEMGSAFRPPDPKRQLSARVRGSILDKVDAIRELWRTKAEADGAASEPIDTTYVVDALLERVCDEELAHFGGYPDTKAKLDAVKAAIRKASSSK